MANAVNVYGGSVTINQIIVTGNPEPQNQPPPSYETHAFLEEPSSPEHYEPMPEAQDYIDQQQYPEHYEPMPEAQDYIDQQQYEPAPDEVYYIDQQPHEPEPTGPDPAYIELLQNVLCRFPWPPPQWHNLALSETDLEFLRGICLANYSVVYHWQRHLAASSDYHRVNKKKENDTGSGFWAFIRWWRRENKLDKAQKAADPRITMDRFKYTPLERGLLIAMNWRNAVRHFLLEFLHSPIGLEDIWIDVWVYAHASMSADAGTGPVMGVDGREMHELESENGHATQYSRPPPQRLEGAYVDSYS